VGQLKVKANTIPVELGARDSVEALTTQCEAKPGGCTQADFDAIDRQMAALEGTATIRRKGTLTQEDAEKLAQFAFEMLPLVGSGEAVAQLITGRTGLSGEEVSRFWAAVGAVPVAGGAFRRVGSAAADGLAKLMKDGKLLFGANGVKTASTTVWKGPGKQRIDIENPNPGKRAGQIHYQDNDGNKYYYQSDRNSFSLDPQGEFDAPKKIQLLLNDESFFDGVKKALRYMGE